MSTYQINTFPEPTFSGPWYDTTSLPELVVPSWYPVGHPEFSVKLDPILGKDWALLALHETSVMFCGKVATVTEVGESDKLGEPIEGTCWVARVDHTA